MLFIGTEFSILYTSMHSPAAVEGREGGPVGRQGRDKALGGAAGRRAAGALPRGIDFRVGRRGRA